jgi:hypothetical protein
METKLSENVIKVLNENEKKGANYGNRIINNDGVIFDYSNNGYHVRVENIK